MLKKMVSWILMFNQIWVNLDAQIIEYKLQTQENIRTSSMEESNPFYLEITRVLPPGSIIEVDQAEVDLAPSQNFKYTVPGQINMAQSKNGFVKNVLIKYIPCGYDVSPCGDQVDQYKKLNDQGLYFSLNSLKTKAKIISPDQITKIPNLSPEASEYSVNHSAGIMIQPRLAGLYPEKVPVNTCSELPSVLTPRNSILPPAADDLEWHDQIT